MEDTPESQPPPPATATATTSPPPPVSSETAEGEKVTFNPLQSFHDEQVRPLLEKASTSFRNAHENTLRKSREIGEATGAFHQEKVRPFLENAGNSFRNAHETTVRKSREIGQATVQKSRELGEKSREISTATMFQTQIAAAAALAKTKHTISQIGENPVERDEDGKVKVKGEETDSLFTSPWSHAIQVVAVGGGLFALVTMVLIEGQLVDIASLITLVLSPLVFWQKMQLNALGGMRAQQNMLRASVNRLTVENDHLSESNDRLEGEVDKLQDVENQLNVLAAESGAQVDRLVKIVQENGEIQKEVTQMLEAEVVQEIMTAVIHVDRDGDFTLNHREVYQLEVKLQALIGIHFDQKMFREFIASDEDDLTLKDVSAIVKNLEDETIPDSEKIFTFKPKEMLEGKAPDLAQV